MLCYMCIDYGNNVLHNKVVVSCLCAVYRWDSRFPCIISKRPSTWLLKPRKSCNNVPWRRRFNHCSVTLRSLNALTMCVHNYFQNDSWLSVKPPHNENTIAVQLKAWYVIFKVRHFHALQLGLSFSDPSFSRLSIFSAPGFSTPMTSQHSYDVTSWTARKCKAACLTPTAAAMCHIWPA